MKFLARWQTNCKKIYNSKCKDLSIFEVSIYIEWSFGPGEEKANRVYIFSTLVPGIQNINVVHKIIHGLFKSALPSFLDYVFIVQVKL